MPSQSIKLINKLGLHARAAMALLKVTERYQCMIQIKYNNLEIDAKDILNVMSLGAPCGAELAITTDGPDENEAMQAIVELINNRFGEAE